MSDSVEVPYGESPSETATLLLAAAEELELDSSVVTTDGTAIFTVPAEVAKQAGFNKDGEKEEKKAPAKKAAAKKSSK